ncbi:MAG: outer membrane beta-barrel protein [bacterium]|nr:outer membrane beta-barrel protein [bacterium]
MNKKAGITLFILLIAAIISGPVFAIGELGIGLNLGITYDPNNLEHEITAYNRAMQAYKAANTGSGIMQLNVPYIPVIGVNFRYQFNYILFRLGCHFAQAWSFATKGNIEEASGTRNNISFDTHQVSIPTTIGLIVPLNKRTLFYFGAGLTLHLTSLKIKQSNPQAAYGLPETVSQNTYTSMFVGYHFIFGAEIPLANRYTISAEFINQRGISPTITSADTSTTRCMNVTTNIILLGVNYYLDF